MNIYVTLTKFLYDHDEIVSTHLTRKGALMHIINVMATDVCSGIDEDELSEYDMPHDPDEDLNSYTSDQLQHKFSDWYEYANLMLEHMSYEWFETQVQP